ncbi:MAG: serine/threonine protein kinase, partial [Psychrosphaera sp.]|nr:serine/threonine protein kinase [Psychrosphaera sp.]
FSQSQCNKAEIIQVQELLALALDEQQNPQHESIISQQLQDLGQKMAPNQRLGAYQIEREIGRGGMGIVFLAHRADGLYEQKVAIKITPSFASQEELQRFHLERQILAQLQHPNIAMLLDGGSTPDNRPFLVMEHIEGEPLTSYAMTHKLNLKQRLKLFCAICEAVSFAHSCLIIHRDLKPENVLVPTEGKVKLLDFGVSKILQGESQSTKTTMQQGLTLAYASPEQIRGESTTTATDVYGLGALLYELLSGKVPHSLKTTSAEEIIKNICLTEPPLPSQIARKDNHPIPFNSIRGDLDNIVGKALHKIPLQRYASANELALDIWRYLDGTPVLATSPSVGYKIAKFALRHPVSSSLATALGLALIGGLIISLNLTRQLTEERVQLQQEVATSQQVITLLTDMFDAASPENSAGEAISIDKLVNTAVRKTRESLAQKPLIKSRLLKVLSQVHNKIGKDQQAVALMEEAHKLKQSNQSLTFTDIAELGNAYRQASKYPLAEQYL